jgi:hypothetical protein
MKELIEQIAAERTTGCGRCQTLLPQSNETGSFGSEVDYAMLVKLYGESLAESPERKLERQHMNLLPEQIILEIEKLRSIFPDLQKVDEIWLAETIFYERDGVIFFFRYDSEGGADAEIGFWSGQIQISWDHGVSDVPKPLGTSLHRPRPNRKLRCGNRYNLDGQMTINRLRSFLYRMNRFLGDVQAVKRGRVVKRAENRIIGRIAGEVSAEALAVR